jgi:antitoxin component YwqK of YwqJK toxin-antitoxin module
MWVSFKLKSRQSVLLLFLCSLNFLSFAQVKPIYFEKNKITSDSTKATSYAVFGKLSNEELWVFKRFDLYNNLIQTGSYKDSLLTKPHGEFVFYNYINDFNTENKENFKSNGKLLFVYQIGNYVDGVENGKWQLFYPDGSPLSLQNFVNGKLEGSYKAFDKFGNILQDGNYSNNQRNGEWFFVREGKKALYEDGTLISSGLIRKEKNRKN